jgi:hypothetical protein
MQLREEKRKKEIEAINKEKLSKNEPVIIVYQPEKQINHTIKYIKLVINYCVAFNNSFLIVGSLAEAYLYGVRMVGNIISVSLGYV